MVIWLVPNYIFFASGLLLDLMNELIGWSYGLISKRVNKRLGSKQPSRSQQDKSHADIQTAVPSAKKEHKEANMNFEKTTCEVNA